MLFSKLQSNITTSSGTASFNTVKFSMGYLRFLTFKPTTSTNVYDINIVDEYGFLVLPTQDIQTLSLTGTTVFHKLDIPMVGIYTVKIVNSTIDEKFTYEMIVQED